MQTSNGKWHQARVMSSTGLVECFIQSFKKSLNAEYHEGSPLQTFSCSTAQILMIAYSAHPDDPYPIMLKPQCEERVFKKQANQVQHHNWHSKPKRVMVWKLRSGQKGIPGTFIEQLGSLTYSSKYNMC